MIFQPNPAELEPVRSRSGQAEHRSVFCPLYDTCLTVAIRRGWADWTCAHCALADKTPTPSATRYSQDRPRD